MHKSEMLKQLKQYFDQNNTFIFHKEFIQDIIYLLSKLSGSETAFFKLLVKQFTYVKDFGLDVKSADHNEVLGYVTEFACYSLHLKSASFNIRFLMTFTEGSTPVFLCAFNERSGKKQTGYAPQITKANQRRKELLED